MTEAINPALGCHYIPPGPQLPSQLQSTTVLWWVPNYAAWWQWQMCIKNLAWVATHPWPDREWNPQPFYCKSDAYLLYPHAILKVTCWKYCRYKYQHFSFFRWFDTIGRVTGRASSLKKKSHTSNSRMFFFESPLGRPAECGLVSENIGWLKNAKSSNCHSLWRADYSSVYTEYK